MLEVLLLVAVLSAEAEGESTPMWEYGTVTNEMTDEVRHYIALKADKPVSTGVKGVRPLLYVRCYAGKEPEVGILFQAYVATRGSMDLRRHITTRFDDGEADSETWYVYGNKRGTPNAFPEEYIARLEAAKRFRVQYSYYGKTSAVVSFTVAGLAEALAPLREACEWPTKRTKRERKMRERSEY